jgi:hypothetical protein
MQLLVDLSKVDWELLSRQKALLVDLSYYSKVLEEMEKDTIEALDGVIHLVDYLQDTVAEQYGVEVYFDGLELDGS